MSDSLDELVDFARTYKAGDKVVVAISKERAKLGSGWEPAPVQKQVRVVIKNEDGEVERTEMRMRHTCPDCGMIVRDEEGLPLVTLPKKRLYCAAPKKVWQGDPHDNTKGTCEEQICAAPLFQKTGLRRWPLSKYIRTKMAGFFKVLISDEFHLFKGKSTDQAGSYHDLVMATRYQINLTGTLFGGKSTDLFWLRYRIDSAVRRDFAFHDEIRWAEMYGRLERTIKSGEVSDGVYSGQRRWVSTAKEVPGISPAIFARLLKSCIFMRITDLGFKLPDYDEHIVHIAMDERQREQYEWLNERLMEYLATDYGSSKEDRLISQKLLGVWLQNCLGRVNSGFRAETVRYSVNKDVKLPVPVRECDLPDWLEMDAIDKLPRVDEAIKQIEADAIKTDDVILHPDYHGEFGLYLEPVIDELELLPKEAWLVDYCVHEAGCGRKVLVYLRQTGTRDIQPRVQQLLAEAGLRAVILPNSVAPKKREQWIRDCADEIDVLLTNPRKVETGLDLVMFSTAIFYEIEYSLFTIWQAMRRVWRLGQTQSVKVLFPIYENSMESAALALMGQKMQAALLLYGDTAASAITDEAGNSGDFTAELAAKILDGEELSSDGITGLLKHTIPDGEEESIWEMPKELEELVNVEPDSVTAEVEPASDVDDDHELASLQKSWEYWQRMQVYERELRLSRAADRRKDPISDAQLSLFG